jgi:hypothetical protein
MVTVFAVLLVVHGLIHILGFVTALAFAELSQLTQPISPIFGALWLVAAFLFVAAAVALFAWPKAWWVIGACAVVVSTIVIVPSWADAKFGTIANVIALVGVVFGFLAQGPFSLRADYDHDVESRLRATGPGPAVTEADLAHLPAPVQRYLRTAGVVGQPRVHNFRARIHGRIRSNQSARWMPLAAEQYNFADPAARLFYMNASMFGIPVQGYHRYVGSAATMHVKAAALVPVVTASGSEMTQSETVTLFNDMCIFAPATLIDSAITWEPVDAGTARARFTNAGHTIRTELSFNESGELTNFVSDDRYQASPDETSLTQVSWSTPIGGYRSFGHVRLASVGEGRWHEPGGEYAYIQVTIDSVEYNVRTR